MGKAASLFALLSAGAVFAASCAAMSSAPLDSPPAWVEGQVLVRFRPWAGAAERERVLSEEGARAEKVLGGTGVLLVQLPAGKTVPDAVRDLSRHPEVEYAEPNYLVKVP